MYGRHDLFLKFGIVLIETDETYFRTGYRLAYLTIQLVRSQILLAEVVNVSDLRRLLDAPPLPLLLKVLDGLLRVVEPPAIHQVATDGGSRLSPSSLAVHRNNIRELC